MCLKCSKQKPAYASRLVQLAVLGGGNPDTKTFKQCQTNQEDHLSKVFGLEVPVNKCNIFSGVSQLFFTIRLFLQLAALINYVSTPEGCC